MKALEAKPFDQNAESWKRENWLFTSTMLAAGAPGKKIESVRTHSEVLKPFDSFSLLKFLFLVRNWHCWSWKAFTRQMTPQSREKAAKTAVFRHRWQARKVVQPITAVRLRPRTPRNWRCSFTFFKSFLWHFNEKQCAEVIFRLSRPVSCKNQENGAGKQWSLHASLKGCEMLKHVLTSNGGSIAQSAWVCWTWTKPYLVSSQSMVLAGYTTIIAQVCCHSVRCAKSSMGPVRIHHHSHHFATQSSHFVDRAGWQAKMASIEFWIPWRNAHGPHYAVILTVCGIIDLKPCADMSNKLWLGTVIGEKHSVCSMLPIFFFRSAS